MSGTQHAIKDIFTKTGTYTAAKEAMRAGYYPYLLPLDESEGTEVHYRGRTLVMCGSNNYLGLTTHPKVQEAAMQAVRKYGTSNTGSRFLNGTLRLHKELEAELADFVGKEDALVFTTGYQTNLGIVQSLVQRDDVAVLDRAAHASIVDGAILSQGRLVRFKHNDVDSLQRALEKIEPERGRLVVVDGVYSMDGDIAPLPQIVAVCKRYGARLMVDDAHATGVFGPHGEGTPKHFGVAEKVDLIMSTFSKSLASVGGFVAGDADVVHYIQHFGRSMIFSASLPAANVAAARAALRIMKAEPERRARVWAIAERVREELAAMGFDTGTSASPIVPIIVGDHTKTLLMWKHLFEEGGVFVNPVLPPAVPANKTLLRTSYMATHTDAQIDRALEAYYKAGKAAGVI